MSLPSGAESKRPSGTWLYISSSWETPSALIWRLAVTASAIALCIAASLRLSTGFLSITHLHQNIRCQTALSDGQWRGRVSTKRGGADHPRGWMPNACYLADYGPSTAKGCLEGSRVVMSGDSSMRALFFATRDVLLPGHSNEGKAHSDLVTDALGVSLEFYWDPWLNRSDLYERLLGVDHGPTIMRRQVKLGDVVDHRKISVLMVGGGLWPIRYGGDAALEDFKGNSSKLRDVVVAAVEGRHTAPNFRVFLRLTPPIIEHLLSETRRPRMTNERLFPFNEHLRSLSTASPTRGLIGNDPADHPIISVTNASYSLLSSAAAMSVDGIHFEDTVNAAEANLILNEVCNSVVFASGPGTIENRVRKGQPTCCVDYGRPSFLQAATIGALAILGTFAYTLRRFFTIPSRLDFLIPKLTTSWNIGMLNFVLYFCFIADRTAAMPKVNKFFSPWEFFGLLLLWAVPALLTLRVEQDSSFLNRYQTDEWKGWMQFFILVYHYTGASANLPIYAITRMLVAAYLFMTGYGHTAYFLSHPNSARDPKIYIPRIVKTLLRLNLAPALLSYVMGTDVAFYYFSPLVSLWFLVVVATWITFPSVNSLPTFAVAKIMVSAACAFVFLSTGALGHLLWILRTIAGLTWDPVESQFRVGLDPLIAHAGMLTAFIVLRVSGPSGARGAWFGWRIDGLADDATSALRWRLWRAWVVSTAWAILCVFAMYAVCLATFSGAGITKQQTNAIHPYISLLVVPAFAIVRNSTPELRSTTSYLLRWMGEISLQTFVLQFHVWLAADTRGLLAPFGVGTSVLRVGGFVVATVAFLGASQVLATSTEHVVEVMMRRWGVGVVGSAIVAAVTNVMR